MDGRQAQTRVIRRWMVVWFIACGGRGRRRGACGIRGGFAQEDDDDDASAYYCPP